MTRRGSRTEGRQPTGDRPAAEYVTTPPPSDAAVLTCGTCGGIYRDYPESRDGHKIALGHWPTQPRKPAPAASETESAPERDQEGEVWTG